MKKCLSLLLALVLSLSVCTVFAADVPDAPLLISPNPISAPAGDETRMFTDVAETDWYCEAIEQAAALGLIRGVSGTEFDPNGELTRGQLVTILWRLEGKPLLTPEKDFAKFYFPHLDTDPIPEWAQNAAVWAGFYGIVKGYPDGTFRANEVITREQFLVMLFRFAAHRGLDAVSLQEGATTFSDSDAISPFAISAVNWAVNTGIVNSEATLLEPQKIVTRADAATMVLRLKAYLEAYDAAMAEAMGK